MILGDLVVSPMCERPIRSLLSRIRSLRTVRAGNGRRRTHEPPSSPLPPAVPACSPRAMPRACRRGRRIRAGDGRHRQNRVRGNCLRWIRVGDGRLPRARAAETPLPVAHRRAHAPWCPPLSVADARMLPRPPPSEAVQPAAAGRARAGRAQERRESSLNPEQSVPTAPVLLPNSSYEATLVDVEVG
uniref:Uncharacterized protein n=1 Tax=Oryza sativa subsp. japonica TaxID=39947 RepID=Q5Z4S2_ORYSJ|nr:hypothetical protein [Oryza sativa Japonica Group]